jgi:hypothetical protein
VFLCSHFPKLRLQCVEILNAVRAIHATAREAERATYEELIPTRMMDIIDETGPDIISRLQQGGGFMDVRFPVLTTVLYSSRKSSLLFPLPSLRGVAQLNSFPLSSIPFSYPI